MVELLLAMEVIGVRFPLPAPKKMLHLLGEAFSFGKASGSYPLEDPDHPRRDYPLVS